MSKHQCKDGTCSQCMYLPLCDCGCGASKGQCNVVNIGGGEFACSCGSPLCAVCGTLRRWRLYQEAHDGMRKFESGATRDTAQGKFEPEKYLSPYLIEEFCRYMHKHQVMKDGTRREGDNWQKGFPEDVLTASFFRHAMDVWAIRRGIEVVEPVVRDGVEYMEAVSEKDAIMACIFNLQAMVHQSRKGNVIRRGA